MTEGAPTDNQGRSVYRFQDGIEPLKTVTAKYLLAIGISKYDDVEITDLANPGRDARKLAQTLQDLYGFEKGNVAIWTNDGEDMETQTDLSQQNINDELDKFVKKIPLASETALMVFIAGHGILDDKNNGYLICQDGLIKSAIKNHLRISTDILEVLAGRFGQVLLSQLRVLSVNMP